MFKTLILVFFIATCPVLAAATPAPDYFEAIAKKDQFALESALLVNADVEMQDANGRTLLMAAAQSNNIQALSHLLEAGASPLSKDRQGQTPLHLAVNSSTEISRLLINAQGGVNAKNVGGVTPLMLAAGAGNRALVELLLTSGARADMKDYRGRSSVDWASSEQHTDIAKILTTKLAAAKNRSGQTESQYEFSEDVFADIRHPDWFKESFLDLRDDVNDAVVAGKKGILVFLSTRRCSYCKVFLDKTLREPDIRQRVQDSFDVVGLEIFNDSEVSDVDGKVYSIKDYVTAKKAHFTPTLIFYGEGGRTLLRIVGYYPPEKFRRVLDYLENNHYLTTSLREYIATTEKSSKGTEKAIIPDDELFTSPPYNLDRRIAPSSKRLLVIFERPDCDSCQRFHNTVLKDLSIRVLIKKYESVQLDMTDAKTGVLLPTGERTNPRQWAEQLDISYSPSILFFDEGGREVLRLDSETLRFRMEGALQLVLEKAYAEDAQLQRWRRKKAVEFMQNDGVTAR